MALINIPESWMPNANMQRIVLHWTAGTHKANATDRKAYHFLVEGDGKLIRGNATVRQNQAPISAGYAAHTLNCNTGSIGVSLCCMGGAKESPFDPGQWPMTQTQFDTMIELVRVLARRYEIPITPKTILSHAEVQANLGIKQRNKWDYTRLAFNPELRGANAIGNHIRSRLLNGTPDMAKKDPIPAGGRGFVRTNGSNLNTRNAPNGDVTGSLPNGTEIEVIAEQNGWLQVTSPAGFKVWVSPDYVEIVDGPAVEEDTSPDPRREKLSLIRQQLNDLLNDLEDNL